ncbi:MAG TPA: hypothetical protein VLX56_07200 [Nitrososphaerales archaeon]|nr:hypothetical protein [Nitrososphaerales archaeon]
MARTNIAVDEETADLLADEAAKENKSLYALTNEALTAVLRVCEYGGTPKDVYPSWRWARILRDTDAIPLPGGFMEKLMQKAYQTDKDWLLKEWFDEGKRVGSYLHMYANEFEQLIPRVGELQGLLPVKRVEIERKEEQDRVNILIRVVGAGFSLESTTCTEHFVMGVLSAFPFRIVSNRISEGMIEISAVEDKKSGR